MELHGRYIKIKNQGNKYFMVLNKNASRGTEYPLYLFIPFASASRFDYLWKLELTFN